METIDGTNSYGYDALNRLISASHPAATDASGNVVERIEYESYGQPVFLDMRSGMPVVESQSFAESLTSPPISRSPSLPKFWRMPKMNTKIFYYVLVPIIIVIIGVAPWAIALYVRNDFFFAICIFWVAVTIYQRGHYEIYSRSRLSPARILTNRIFLYLFVLAFLYLGCLHLMRGIISLRK